MADLEQDIGELKGMLKGFVPTVETISSRVNENRDKIIETGKDLELHKKEVWRAVRTLETGAKEDQKEDKELHEKVGDLKRDVKTLMARSRGIGKFVIRVGEMLIAALIGGAAALFFGGK